MKSLFVFAGDVSADRHTARLLAELKCHVPELFVWGCGGSQMRAVGVEILYDLEQFGVFGIVEVLRSIPFFARLCKEMVSVVEQRKPDAVLLVDFGGFNLQLAKKLRKQNSVLPIIYFISPQVWGSRPWRMKAIVKTISKMLVIFPFEQALYRNAGVDAVFVGHPLINRSSDLNQQPCSNDSPTRCDENRSARIAPRNPSLHYGLDTSGNLSRPVIGIMPGSRLREIKDMMPVILQSMTWLKRLVPKVQFVISQANATISEEIKKRGGKKLLKLINEGDVTLAPIGENQPVMLDSDLLWVKSGTSTLEAALAAKPMLIFYRANWISYLLFLIFKRVKYVGLPNLLTGFEVAPELIQLDCRAEQLVRLSLDFVDVPGLRTEISHELSKIKNILGSTEFPRVAAQEVCKVLDANTPAIVN